MGGAGVHAIVHRLTRQKSDNEELNDTAVRLLRDELDSLRQKNNLMESYNAQHTQKIGVLEKQNYELEDNELDNATNEIKEAILSGNKVQERLEKHMIEIKDLLT